MLSANAITMNKNKQLIPDVHISSDKNKSTHILMGLINFY